MRIRRIFKYNFKSKMYKEPTCNGISWLYYIYNYNAHRTQNNMLYVDHNVDQLFSTPDVDCSGKQTQWKSVSVQNRNELDVVADNNISVSVIELSMSSKQKDMVEVK